MFSKHLHVALPVAQEIITSHQMLEQRMKHNNNQANQHLGTQQQQRELIIVRRNESSDVTTESA